MALFLGMIVFGWLLIASFAQDLIPSDVLVLIAAGLLYLLYMGILFFRTR